jgi:hypothetical protein
MRLTRGCANGGSVVHCLACDDKSERTVPPDHGRIQVVNSDAQSRILAAVFVLVAVLCTSGGAMAQESDGWQITVVPYLIGAAMSGTTAINGWEAEVDLSASDVFSHLKWGAMGYLEARKGDWSSAAT